jgi:hypothetical protein
VIVVAVLGLAHPALAQAPDTTRVQVGAEALTWWFKGAAAPPLVTNGLLSQPGTRTLLGGDGLDTDPNLGFRLTASYALTERWTLEGGVFYIPSRSTSRSVSSSGLRGSPDLSIPFFDVTHGRESDSALSSAGVFAGRATEELTNSLLGAEVNATMRVAVPAPWRLDALGGIRYLRLRETYTFTTDSPDIPPQPAGVFRTTDEFDASNHFVGVQVGARAGTDWGAWFAAATLKLGLGAMIQSVDVSGQLVTDEFTNNVGAPRTFAGGYFALPTNIGGHTRTVFAVVPEAALTVGYRITPWLSVFGGYTLLYASNVVRAPEQINRTINPTQSVAITGNVPAPLKGPAEPSFRFNASDFWAQGLNAGLAFRF